MCANPNIPTYLLGPGPVGEQWRLSMHNQVDHTFFVLKTKVITETANARQSSRCENLTNLTKAGRLPFLTPARQEPCSEITNKTSHLTRTNQVFSKAYRQDRTTTACQLEMQLFPSFGFPTRIASGRRNTPD